MRVCIRQDYQSPWTGCGLEIAGGLMSVNTEQLPKELGECRLSEKEGEIAADFLRLVNESRSKADLVRASVRFFQEQSACEAVGIRLKEGDDYPYYEARGFPQEFVTLENWLCTRDACGRPMRDSAGYPIMECMCGNVIQGRFDPSKPFFSAKGSFWTNCTTELLATSTEADRQARTRNRCNGEGYESVALIALRAGEERLGLLQMNDRRKGRFSPETIILWERLAGYLAVALAKFEVEEHLRKSEEEYRSLFENMLNGFAYCKMLFEGGEAKDFIYLRVNGAFETLTGLRNVTGKRVSEVIPGIRESQPELFEIYGRVALTGNPEQFEICIEPLGGMWFSVSVYSPKKEHFVAIFDVITERKRAEESLQSSGKRLQTLMDAAPVSVSWTDPSGNIVYCNRKFIQLFGYTLEDIPTINDWRMRAYPDPAYRETVRPLVPAILEAQRHGGDVEPMEVMVACKDGSVRWVAQTGATASGLNLAIYTDLTERKKAEEILRISRAQLSDAADLAHIAYWEADPESEEFIFNDSFYALFGTTAEKEGGYRLPLTEYPKRFVHPDDLERYYRHVQQTNAGQPELAQFEHRVVRRDGEVRHIVNRARFVWDPAERLARVYGTNQDITERKKAEEMLQQLLSELELKNRELEAAYADLKTSHRQILQQEKMASIGVLAAGVAHEINNPMGFIISNLNSLQKYTQRLHRYVSIQSDAIEALSQHGNGAAESILAHTAESRLSLKIDYILDDSQSLVKESLEGADRVKRIVQDLKSFSRVDGTEIAPTDINKVLESTINIVWNELKHKATLKKEYGDVPPVPGNHGQFSQVFMNIFVNAVQAIQDHGEIAVRTWEDGSRIHVAISDTGCGIPEDQMSRLFEPFYTTKEIGQGTGLGLSIAYDIVKKHHGEIEARSTVGQGTTFTVTFPLEVV